MNMKYVTLEKRGKILSYKISWEKEKANIAEETTLEDYNKSKLRKMLGLLSCICSLEMLLLS